MGQGVPAIHKFSGRAQARSSCFEQTVSAVESLDEAGHTEKGSVAPSKNLICMYIQNFAQHGCRHMVQHVSTRAQHCNLD